VNQTFTVKTYSELGRSSKPSINSSKIKEIPNSQKNLMNKQMKESDNFLKGLGELGSHLSVPSYHSGWQDQKSSLVAQDDSDDEEEDEEDEDLEKSNKTRINYDYYQISKKPEVLLKEIVGLIAKLESKWDKYSLREKLIDKIAAKIKSYKEKCQTNQLANLGRIKINVLGKEAFGSVTKMFHRMHKDYLAEKIIRKKDSSFDKMALNELRVLIMLTLARLSLQNMHEHPCIFLSDFIYTPRDQMTIVMEYGVCDLKFYKEMREEKGLPWSDDELLIS